MNSTKAGKKEISQQLNRTVIDLGEKSAELDKVSTELQETTSQLTETETKLSNTEKNLDQIGTRLNETKARLSATEGELQELKINLLGHNCFRMTNSSHWDILYTASFFNQALTEDKLQFLDTSWEKLGEKN